MNYWDEIKRIQVSMRSASIPTNEASDIINEITKRYGYLFTVDNIYNVAPIEEIRSIILRLKTAILMPNLQQHWRKRWKYSAQMQARLWF